MSGNTAMHGHVDHCISYSDEDENDIAYEDDKTDENWEPDNRKWCICKQPHNNRFVK